MNRSEKILIFHTCGMVLWVLKEIVYHSQMERYDREKIVQKINTLIKPITEHINNLRSSID